jgi:uncharacterized protein
LVEEDEPTIQMTVSAVCVDPFTALPVVLLRDPCGRATVNVTVGLGEASAIATEVEGIQLERPTTHHLMSSVLTRAGVKVERIEIHDLVDCRFYARIYLRLPTGEQLVEESRPSDALALALRTGAEIRVAVRVLECAARLSRRGGGADVTDPLGDAELADHTGERSFYKWKM